MIETSVAFVLSREMDAHGLFLRIPGIDSESMILFSRWGCMAFVVRDSQALSC